MYPLDEVGHDLRLVAVVDECLLVAMLIEVLENLRREGKGGEEKGKEIERQRDGEGEGVLNLCTHIAHTRRNDIQAHLNKPTHLHPHPFTHLCHV